MAFSRSLPLLLLYMLSATAHEPKTPPYDDSSNEIGDVIQDHDVNHNHDVMMPKGDDMAAGELLLLPFLARKVDSLEQRVEAQDEFLSLRFSEYMMTKGAVDGRWSAWGEWLPCSSSCNGKSLRFRHCNSPTPSNGGKACVGDSMQTSPCNMECMASEVEVRLVGGSRPSEGRLEVFEDEKWGTVCDRNFSLSDAIVVCKMLGYPQVPQVLGGAYHGEGHGPIFFCDLNCKGTEKDLFHCPGARSGYVNTQCRHSDDVGIDCEPTKPKSKRKEKVLKVTSVRLSGGPRPSKGRLEVQVNGNQWGTVCDDHFDVKDAIVACRMLNMISGFEPVLVKDYTNTAPRGPVLLDDMHCSGEEHSFDQCKHPPIGRHSCHHYEDVGVDCMPAFNESIKAHCPPDFMEYKGFCYFFSDDKTSRAYATKQCKEMHGHLLEIRDAEEGNYISKLIQNKTAELVWLGVKKSGSGDYVFDTDGRKPNFTNWILEELNNIPTAEGECAAVTADGQWMEARCDLKTPFVCQKHGKLRPQQMMS